MAATNRPGSAGSGAAATSRPWLFISETSAAAAFDDCPCPAAADAATADHAGRRRRARCSPGPCHGDTPLTSKHYYTESSALGRTVCRAGATMTGRLSAHCALAARGRTATGAPLTLPDPRRRPVPRRAVPSARSVTARSRALSRRNDRSTAASTVPPRRALTRVPAGVRRRTARRRSPADAPRSSSPWVPRRPSTPVNVLGWMCSSRASAPAETPGKQPDDPQDQALRAGDAGPLFHAFGGPLQRVDDRPQHPHELQDVAQFVDPRLRRRVLRCRHGSHYSALSLWSNCSRSRLP